MALTLRLHIYGKLYRITLEKAGCYGEKLNFTDICLFVDDTTFPTASRTLHQDDLFDKGIF